MSLSNRYGRTDDELAAIQPALREGYFSGKVVLISGAGSGIGRALAHWAARLGAEVVLCGRDAAKLTRELASRRSDKPNPLYYAQRTVDVASARLWMLDGIPPEDIVTMLECRRRFEISAPPCSARAREITATAARMIARK